MEDRVGVENVFLVYALPLWSKENSAQMLVTISDGGRMTGGDKSVSKEFWQKEKYKRSVKLSRQVLRFS